MWHVDVDRVDEEVPNVVKNKGVKFPRRRVPVKTGEGASFPGVVGGAREGVHGERSGRIREIVTARHVLAWHTDKSNAAIRLKSNVCCNFP
jgi:hypothetical protein